MLANGLTVVVVERRDLPVVSLEIVVAPGATFDRSDQAGLTSMTAEMLDEGTSTRSALVLAEEIDYLGAELSIQAGWDATIIVLDVLSNRLEPAVDLVADILINAAYPDDEYARKQKERLATLLLENDEPEFLAGKALAAAVFGSTHPYGKPIVGTRASIEHLTCDDTNQLYRATFHAGNSFVIVVGDVATSAVVALLEARLGAWRSAPPAAWSVARPPAINARRIVLVDKPGAEQAELRIGHAAPDRATPDYFAIKVMNTILGGSFTSRLNTILRERMAVTYGARSRFRLRRADGIFSAGAAVATDAAARSAQVVVEEMVRLRAEAVAGDELRRAQNYVALGLPRFFESTADIAAHLREQMLYGLPADYWETYVDNVMAITSDDVARAAARHLQPEACVITLVADRQLVRTSLENAGLGEVESMDVPT